MILKGVCSSSPFLSDVPTLAHVSWCVYTFLVHMSHVSLSQIWTSLSCFFDEVDFDSQIWLIMVSFVVFLGDNNRKCLVVDSYSLVRQVESDWFSKDGILEPYIRKTLLQIASIRSSKDTKHDPFGSTFKRFHSKSTRFDFRKNRDLQKSHKHTDGPKNHIYRWICTKTTHILCASLMRWCLNNLNHLNVHVQNIVCLGKLYFYNFITVNLCGFSH